MQDKHTKMKNLQYEGLKTQNYFYRTDITNDQKKIIFQFRKRMADFGENYRGGRDQVNCPLCYIHCDKQELSYTWKIIQNEVELKGSFEEVYSDDISIHTIEDIQKITEVRKEILTNNKTLPLMAHVSQGAKPSAA